MSDDLDGDLPCESCGRRRPLFKITLPDGAGTFRMCVYCAADHIREMGAEHTGPNEGAA